MLHQIKAPQFYTDLGLQKTLFNPPVNGKIQGLSRPLSVFQVLLKAYIIFKDFSRQSCTFKYFSSLCEPCGNLTIFCSCMNESQTKVLLPLSK